MTDKALAAFEQELKALLKKYKAEIQADSYRHRARKLMPRTICADCGTRDRLHAHHRDRNVANNSPENLVVLCASCHLRLHWREDREERLAAMRAAAPRTASMRQQYTDGKAYSDAQRRARQSRQDEKARRASASI